MVLRRMGREAVKAFRGSSPYSTGIRKRKAPDGTPFEPLKQSTLDIRQKRGIKRRGAFILRETGTHIIDQIRIIEIGNDYAIVGVEGGKNEIIASAHHTGFTTSESSMIPGKPVPARPIFGVSEELASKLNEIVDHFIRRGIVGVS